MASNLKHKPTGFFDLPLELRQMVYEQLLPPDMAVKFTKTRCQIRRNLTNVYQSDGRLREEIASWENKRYTQAHFMVTPKPWDQPESFYHYKNLEWIVIGIDHYDMDSPYHRIIQIDNMRDNLEKMVKAITTYHERNGRMPNLVVKFREVPRESGRGDLHWCKALDWDESTTGDLLDTIEDSPYSETIFTYLLEALLKLPVCRKARIKVLENLHGCDPEDHEPDHSRFEEIELLRDHWYAESYCEMMEAWLDGRISRETPFVSQWVKYRGAFWRGASDPEYESICAILHDRKRVIRNKKE